MILSLVALASSRAVVNGVAIQNSGLLHFARKDEQNITPFILMQSSPPLPANRTGHVRKGTPGASVHS